MSFAAANSSGMGELNKTDESLSITSEDPSASIVFVSSLVVAGGTGAGGGENNGGVSGRTENK
jgi:hypothetical protein